METKANYVAVGGFIMALIIGFVIALLWLTGAQYAQEYAYYQTYFSGSVSGLGAGTSVRYNGIEVGRVKKLNFDQDNPKRVQVVMQIDPSLRIHADSIASIASLGLTGGSFVEIDGGSKKAPVLRPQFWGDMPVIRSKPSTLTQIEESAPQLINKLNKAADKLNNILSEKNQQALSEILANLHDTTTVLSARSEDIDATLRNFNTASQKLDGDLSDMHTTLVNVDGLVGNADKTVLSINQLAGNLDKTVSSAQLDRVSGDLRRLLDNLAHLSSQLDRQPTSLIFGDRREGYTPK